MPQFFLHIHHKNCTIEDHEGSEHADLSSAREEAIESARQIMADKVLQGYLPTASRLSIVDVTGAVVLVVPFLDAVVVD